MQKGGHPSNGNNYRPISNLQLSKIFENTNLSHNILNPCQSGFRQKTNDAIIKMLNLLYTALENNEYPLGLFVDL